jgi:signal recognition particle subunit SRP54
MFSGLSENLSAVLQRLAGQGVLTEEAIKEGLREVRRVLLEADVSYELTRDFVERIRERAVGLPKIKAVRPGQQLVKIVHDELVRLLGESKVPLQFASVPPTVILLVGLQGSGKTTTAAKLARRLKREQKAPFLIAADVYRPAAEEQLRQLGEKVEVGVYGAADDGRRAAGDKPIDVVALVEDGLVAARKAKARSVIVDTAGRLQIDDAMMEELGRIKKAVDPHEVLLVADAMTGQDAVRIATGFNEGVGVTGVILTKLDGDARGGAALSMRGVTGAPIKYVGVGEGVEALEPFDPVRMAGRILQQGDVVGLVEAAQDTVSVEEAERLARKATSKKGMDLEDFLASMRQMQKMGPLKSVLGMLPGVNAKMMKQVDADPKRLSHVEAIILSMTPQERKRPKVLNGSRRARIARGAGRPVYEVNQLVKQFEQMAKMMRKGGPGGLPGMMQQFPR